MFKVDQEILKEYFPGRTIKKSLKTPYVRSYVSTEDEACVISTPSLKNKIAGNLAVVAAEKSWNLLIFTKRKLLVCLLLH